ncbi:MAG: phage terminase large subunit family protein, partial [Deltaproteobacteria bacterium]|nr:phage terminase large subunit family protein [Deltaproteobacteria bacterium]
MIASGEWKAQKKVKGIARKIGFHLPAWLSPWLTWGDCAAEFLRSIETPERMMNFVNSWKAEVWVYKYESKNMQELKNNMVDIPEYYCPTGTIALTAG